MCVAGCFFQSELIAYNCIRVVTIVLHDTRAELQSVDPTGCAKITREIYL